MPRPSSRVPCGSCGAWSRLQRYRSIDGKVNSFQIECRECGRATAHYVTGQEQLAEAEWDRLNQPAEGEVLAELGRLRGGVVVLFVIAPSVSVSIPGRLDLEVGKDGYEVQHGQAICRFQPGAVNQIENRHIYLKG